MAHRILIPTPLRPFAGKQDVGADNFDGDGLVEHLIAGAQHDHLLLPRGAHEYAFDQAQMDRLHALEVRFQDWQPTVVPMEMPTNERSTATARSYQSVSTGRTGVVTIISGIPGSVSTHTPDVCYVGSGYKLLRGPNKETIQLPGGASATVYTADFEKKSATKADRVRVRWAWSTDGAWLAQTNWFAYVSGREGRTACR